MVPFALGDVKEPEPYRLCYIDGAKSSGFGLGTRDQSLANTSLVSHAMLFVGVYPEPGVFCLFLITNTDSGGKPLRRQQS